MHLAKEMADIAAQSGLQLNYDPKEHIINTVYDVVHQSFPQLAFSIAIKNEILYVHWETKTGFHERGVMEFSKEALHQVVQEIQKTM
jgi:hypothetical protein